MEDYQSQIDRCSQDLKTIEFKTAETWHFYVQAVGKNEGMNETRAREILHVLLDASLDNYSSAINLRKLIEAQVNASKK